MKESHFEIGGWGYGGGRLKQNSQTTYSDAQCYFLTSARWLIKIPAMALVRGVDVSSCVWQNSLKRFGSLVQILSNSPFTAAYLVMV